MTRAKAHARQAIAVARNQVDALPYTPALDGIRCVAIALVVASHAVSPAHFGGDVGVDVFFALSGYLITTILMNDLALQRLSLKTFYARRMIRLAPALVASVAMFVPIALIVSSDRRDIILGGVFALLYLTPITSTVFPTPGSWFGHTWTLGLEEYFYLVWPLVLGFLYRRRASWMFAAGLVGGTGVLLLAVKWMADPEHTIPMGQLRIGGIAIGCAIAIVLRHISRVRVPTLLVAIGILTIIGSAFITNDGPLSTAGFLIADIGTAVAILGLMGGGHGFARRLLELRLIVYLGKISYEIYLVHYPVMIAATMILHAAARDVAWWAIPLSVALAAGMHEAFKPLQRVLRARFGKRASARAVAG